MTQNEKELLLQDICARLPYGVKCYIPEANDTSILAAVLEDGENTLFNFWEDSRKIQYWHQLYISEFKPYLFPLSSMTDEQAEELFGIFGLKCPSTEEDYIKINEVTGITFFLLNGFDVETHLDKLVDWLNKNHFDYRGLIPKGLAINATKLNIY